jgi:hypothetical protein
MQNNYDFKYLLRISANEIAIAKYFGVTDLHPCGDG